MAKSNTFQIRIGNFTGGLNTLDSPYDLSDNESTILQNFDIIGKGSIRKRYGYDIVSSGGSTSKGVRGLVKYRKSNGDKFLLIANDNKLFTITPSSSTWVDKGSYGGSGDNRIGGTVFGDLAIFGDGEVKARSFNGSTHQELSASAPTGNIFTVYNLLLFASGENGSTSSRVYWCDESDPVTWTGLSPIIAGNIDISYLDGTTVNGIVWHNNELNVFKDKTKHALTPILDSNSGRPLNFREQEVIDHSDGTRAGNTIAEVWDGLYFLGTPEFGFQKYGIQERFPDRRTPESLSFKISPTVNQINPSEIDKSTAIFFNNRYYCASPFGTGNVNNTVFVYNRIFNSWSIFDNIPASDFEIFEDSKGTETIYFGSEHEGKILKFNNRFSDEYDNDTGEGTSINAFWRSKTYVPSIGNNNFKRIFIKGKMTNPATSELKMTVVGSGITKYVATKTFQITEKDIDQSIATGGYTGDFSFGNQYFNSGVGVSGSPSMFDFFKEIQLSETVNYGREFYLELSNNHNNQGIQLDWITVEGELPKQIVVK